MSQWTCLLCQRSSTTPPRFSCLDLAAHPRQAPHMRPLQAPDPNSNHLHQALCTKDHHMEETRAIVGEPIRFDSKLLSRRQAAQYLGVKEQTLAIWKCTGRYNLPCVKVGRLVKYRLSDLDAFIAGRMVEGNVTF